jgi:hypothetical protein
MKSRHIQEMDCWPQRPDPPVDDDLALLKALVIGVPLGLALWLGIIWAAPRIWAHLISWALSNG